MKLLLSLLILIPSATYATDCGTGVFIDLGNDAIGVSASDIHLTSDLSAGVSTTDVGSFLSKVLFGKEDSCYNFSINQKIYTPDDIDVEEFQPEARPFGSYLFAQAESVTREGNNLVITGLQIGVVGPSALGQELQELVHKVTGSRDPSWANQLDDYFGLNAYHMRGRSFRKENQSRWGHEAVIHGSAMVGSVNNHVDAGVLYRAGYNMPDDMGRNLLNAGEFGRKKGAPKWHIYAFADATGRYVIYDHFIQGHPDSEIDKEDFVNALKFGAVVGIRNFEVGYMNTRVSKQFKQQEKADNRGLLFLRFLMNF